MNYSQRTFNLARDYLLNTTGDATPKKLPMGSERSLWANCLPGSPKNHYDEVYPGIFLGDK